MKKYFDLDDNNKELTVQKLKYILKDLPDNMIVKLDIDTSKSTFVDKVRYIQEINNELRIQNW